MFVGMPCSGAAEEGGMLGNGGSGYSFIVFSIVFICTGKPLQCLLNTDTIKHMTYMLLMEYSLFLVF